MTHKVSAEDARRIRHATERAMLATGLLERSRRDGGDELRDAMDEYQAAYSAFLASVVALDPEPGWLVDLVDVEADQ